MSAAHLSLVRNGFASPNEYHQYLHLKKHYIQQLLFPEQPIALLGVGVDYVHASRGGRLDILVAQEDRGDDLVDVYRQHVQDCAQRVGLTTLFALSYDKGRVTISGDGLGARAFLQAYEEIVGRELE